MDLFGTEGRLLYGADYNPDQWLDRPDILTRDVEMMKAAGCSSMTLGVFSWTSYEPEEGEFCFDWLDAAMDRLAAADIKVFLATPSGGKPTWLSEKYPEVRRVNREKVRDPSGRRHNHCLTSPVYREKVAIINDQLARRYRGHPALVLWHLSNELSGECFCAHCIREFQEWLKKRYVSLDQLNASWWTSFWNHTFTDWVQITPFDQSIDGMALDWLRFTNDQHVSFLKDELKPLREHTPNIPCTTNFMSTFYANNYYQWSKVMDVVSNDRYPLHDDREDSWKVSMRSEFINTLMRGMADGKPWVQMECSPSSVNWWNVNKLKRPGVHISECMQYIANGADALHYFQWRKGRGGFEKYHGAVVDHDGSDQTRVFQECSEIGDTLKNLSGLAGGDRDQSRVAIVYDWESKWALDVSCGPRKARLEYPKADDVHTQTAREHFNAMVRLGVNADITFKDRNWSEYDCIVLPSLYLIEAEVAEKIKHYAENGGCVVGTYLTGYVDDSNRVWTGGLPGGGLREVFGMWNEEIDYLFDEDENGVCFEGKQKAEGTVSDFAELIHTEGAEVLARYKKDFYAGRPLVTEHRSESGIAYYVGARISEGALIQFYEHVFSQTGLTMDSREKGVVFRERCDRDGRTLGFLFNFRKCAQSVEIGVPWTCLKTGEVIQGNIRLQPYETKLLSKHSPHGHDAMKKVMQ